MSNRGTVMTEILYSPMTGEAVNLDDVSDEMFSARMLGDGMAVIPNDSSVYSPVNGTVTMVYKTKHAIALRSEGGVEILIHMGIDTVMLEGVPFETMVQPGDIVKIGDILAVADLPYIRGKGYDVCTPILALEKEVVLLGTGAVSHGDPLFQIQL